MHGVRAGARDETVGVKHRFIEQFGVLLREEVFEAVVGDTRGARRGVAELRRSRLHAFGFCHRTDHDIAHIMRREFLVVTESEAKQGYMCLDLLLPGALGFEVRSLYHAMLTRVSVTQT